MYNIYKEGNKNLIDDVQDIERKVKNGTNCFVILEAAIDKLPDIEPAGIE